MSHSHRTEYTGIRFIFWFISLFGFLSIPHMVRALGGSPHLYKTWDEILKEFWGNLPHHLGSLGSTFLLGGIAIVLSIIFGVILGVLFSYFDRFMGRLESVAKFIWSIPLIAVAVYLNIILTSTFIYIIITGLFLGIYPILSHAYHKANEHNDGIISLAASFNLTRYEEYRHLRIREVIGTLFYPLAQSVPLAYIGVTMGEYTYGRVSGTNEFGLGSDFQFAMQYSKFEKVYVAIILMIFLVFLSGEVFEILSRRKSNSSYIV